MVDEEKVIIFKLTEEELRLVVHWREKCNQNKTNTCPLYCIKEGTDFCHSLGSKFIDGFKKLTNKRMLIEFEKENFPPSESDT